MASSSNSTTTASSISRELTEIDEEVKLIDGQLSELKQRKRKLLEKRDQLLRLVEKRLDEASNSDSQWESETFTWSAAIRQSLSKVFKMNEFRELQLSVMNACLSGEDAILIMSTGGGKSLCYQLPAVISDGVTLVISPLVSLMEDQVMALENFGIESAMLDQSCPPARLTQVQNAMVDKTSRTLKLIYVTPEKIAKSKRFMAKLEKCYEMGRLKLIAVDEVHCCSQWGHDFRPDYKFLNILKRQFPKTPLLGLTATAGERVVDDVKNMLNIPAALVFRASFNRKNLFYEVRAKSSDNAAFLADICKMIKDRFAGQCGIVYCFSKKESEELTKGLRYARSFLSLVPK